MPSTARASSDAIRWAAPDGDATMGALIRSRLRAGMGVALLLTVVGFPTTESRAQEQSPAPQISDGEVEAIRTYLLSPGYMSSSSKRGRAERLASRRDRMHVADGDNKNGTENHADDASAAAHELVPSNLTAVALKSRPHHPQLSLGERRTASRCSCGSKIRPCLAAELRPLCSRHTLQDPRHRSRRLRQTTGS